MDEERRRKEFLEIGLKHGTDKISQHSYHRFYPRYLKELGSIKDFGMLEIGIDRSMSLATWLEYFPDAYIYGMDIGMESKGDRYSIFRGDQSKPEDLMELRRSILTLNHKIYFINDDGSHVPEHQIMTFNDLFVNLLQPGGIYIIEDIETSYWKRGHIYGYDFSYGYKNPKSVVQIFKSVVDDINKEYLSSHDKEVQMLVNDSISVTAKGMISTVTFGANCIIITKKTFDEMAMHDRSYRFGDNTR
ncbi:Hypothetical protein POVR1_LOCUS55 [uncultured virus]|nr:Hypothetical protein POVR1_LOCUS55 [uncultured virus]